MAFVSLYTDILDYYYYTHVLWFIFAVTCPPTAAFPDFDNLLLVFDGYIYNITVDYQVVENLQFTEITQNLGLPILAGIRNVESLGGVCFIMGRFDNVIINSKMIIEDHLFHTMLNKRKLK